VEGEYFNLYLLNTNNPTHPYMLLERPVHSNWPLAKFRIRIYSINFTSYSTSQQWFLNCNHPHVLESNFQCTFSAKNIRLQRWRFAISFE